MYRLDTPKGSSRSTPKTSPGQTPSSSATESSSLETELLEDNDISPIPDYANALPWPGTFELFPEAALEPPRLATSWNDFAEYDNAFHHSLLTTGKHIPDPQATIFAFELGSGFREINHLPGILEHAQRRAVGATVALDQYQRESLGAPLLEEIVEEAEQSHTAFQVAGLVASIATTSEGLIAECCRLAGLIYCELVLFPSSSDNVMILRLASELQTALEIADFWVSEEESTGPVSNMFLWAVTMGAMGDVGASSRAWFIRKLSRMMSSNQKLCDWQIWRSLRCPNICGGDRFVTDLVESSGKKPACSLGRRSSQSHP